MTATQGPAVEPGAHAPVDRLHRRWPAHRRVAPAVQDPGFVEVGVGPAVDIFGGAGDEANGDRLAVFGRPFAAH